MKFGLLMAETAKYALKSKTLNRQTIIIKSRTAAVFKVT
jgi:hypothetical protein